MVATALMVHWALKSAEELEKGGIGVEVINLRTLVPLDKKTILNSVRKTHRLVVVDEDYKSYGMSGEIAAIVAEEAFRDLIAPIKRVAVPDVPYLIADHWKNISSPQKILDAIRAVAGEGETMLTCFI